MPVLRFCFYLDKSRLSALEQKGEDVGVQNILLGVSEPQVLREGGVITINGKRIKLLLSRQPGSDNKGRKLIGEGISWAPGWKDVEIRR